MPLDLELPDEQFKIAAFSALVDHLQQIGIKLESSEENGNSQREALAFAIESIHHVYSKMNWRQLLVELVNKVNAYTDAKEASWFIDRQIEALFKAVALEILIQADEERRRNMDAISSLFLATKQKNVERHKKGLPVHFGGIPRDMLPSWYQP